MKHFINIIAGILCMASLNGCLKDNGNYKYNYGNEVAITIPLSQYNAFIGDTTRVFPARKYKVPADSGSYGHEWYIDGVLYSTDSVLAYKGVVSGLRYVNYYMIDRKNGGISFAAPVFWIFVSSPLTQGWGILYEKDGKSELGHVRITNGEYFDYTDLYKQNNNGAELGTGPVKIKDFAVRGGRGLFVMQRGGQGSVELDASNMKKMLLNSQAWTSGIPTGFTPTDMGFYSTSDFLVNNNGDLYSRAFNGALPYTVPFISTPVNIPRGIKIADIWDSFSGTSTFAMMYDKLNKRVLRMRTNIFVTNGGVTIDTLILPTTPYPANYTPPQNLGNWEYVWGGTFNDINTSMDAAMILRDPADQKLYYETFNYIIASTGAEKLTPKSRILFPAAPYITSSTLYAPLKSRDYLFFTSGADNDMLYYYDVKSESIVKLYTQFSSRINTITSADDSNSLAVGLEDGTFVLFDVSNAVIISGVSKELHRFTGLGRVVDIAVKSGKTN